MNATESEAAALARPTSAVRERCEFDEVVDGRVGDDGAIDDEPSFAVCDREPIAGLPSEEQVVAERRVLRAKHIAVLVVEVDRFAEHVVDHDFGSAR